MIGFCSSPLSGDLRGASIMNLTKLPEKIQILERATALVKGKLKNIRLMGTVTPPPPIPPAIASEKATNIITNPIISIVTKGYNPMC